MPNTITIQSTRTVCLESFEQITPYTWGSNGLQWIDLTPYIPTDALAVIVCAQLFRAIYANQHDGIDATVLINLPDPTNNWQPCPGTFAILCTKAGSTPGVLSNPEYGGFGQILVPIRSPAHLGFYAGMSGTTLQYGCNCAVGLMGWLLA
jgi:hypothetical protein